MKFTNRIGKKIRKIKLKKKKLRKINLRNSDKETIKVKKEKI